MLRALSFILALTAASAANAATFTCRPMTKFAYSSAECKSVAPAVWTVIDSQAQTYTRCDTKGCDVYPAEMTRSGNYLVVSNTRGIVVKIDALKLEQGIAAVGMGDAGYLEVITVGTTPMISFGECVTR